MEYRNLLEICEVYQPKTIATKDFQLDGAYYVYGANGIIGRYNQYNHEESEVVMACRGATCGVINVTHPQSWVNGNAMVIRPNGKIKLSKRYLQYCLQAVDKRKIISGTAQPQITRNNLRDLLIPICAIEEQARIVARIEELFSQLESGVVTLKQTKEQLAVYRQAVLKEAFDNEQYPKKKASEVGIVHLGRQRSPKNVSKDYPTKYIRAANITESGINVTNVEVLEMEFTPKEREKYYLKKGDIVLSEASGSATQVGKPAIWNNEISNCCFQNTVIRHRIKEDNPEYILWYYKFLYINGFFSRMVGGVGINHIGASNFSNISIPIPPKEKQAEIVRQLEEKLSVCDQIEQTVDAALQQAEALRQSILKKAFEGGL